MRVYISMKTSVLSNIDIPEMRGGSCEPHTIDHEEGSGGGTDTLQATRVSALPSYWFAMWLAWISSYFRYIKDTFEHVNKHTATHPEGTKFPAGASAARRGEDDLARQTRTPGGGAGCKDHRDLIRAQWPSSLHQFSQKTKWFPPFLPSVSPHSFNQFEPENKEKSNNFISHSHSRQ